MRSDSLEQTISVKIPIDPHRASLWPDWRAIFTVWARNSKFQLLFVALLSTVITIVEVRAEPGTVGVEAKPIQLHQKDPNVRKIGRLSYLGGLSLSAVDGEFGGFSGLAVSADGKHLLAITDRGALLRADLAYSQGKLSGFSDGQLCPLKNGWGEVLRGKKGDAEALVILADGSLAVSFERNHRIDRYPPATAQRADCSKIEAARALYRIPSWNSLPANGGFEALVALDETTTLAISEGGDTSDGRLIGWLLRQQGSTSIYYQPSGNGYKPTDLTRLPDGNILLLERRFTILSGVSSRLCLIDKESIKVDVTMTCNLIAEISSPLAAENYEGLSSRLDERGNTVIYMISDDNFNPFQRTILMMFKLEES